MMTTRKFLIAILLLVASYPASSQKMNMEERKYFVLGSLNDYMGRCLDPRFKDYLDRYYANEEPLVNIVDSLLMIDYPASSFKTNRYHDTTGKPLSFDIQSSSLSAQYNSYYVFKPSGSSTVSGDPELNNKTIYYGVLKPDIFKTDATKLAFIAGAYVRYGVANDTAYMINVANSASKVKVLFELLKAFNCKPTYETLKNIPVIHRVYFHPDSRLEAYLKPFLGWRKEMEKAWDDLMQQFLREEKKNKN